MAKKENKFKGYDISTQAVHTGVAYDAETGAVRRPLHMANSYKLPDDLSKVNYSSTDLLMYARNGNPNQHWLEEKVAALHGADDAIVLGSGVAALHALFWTLLKTGDRIVYPKVSYMAVYRLFHELFNRKFGVETVMVDMTDLEAVKKAITPGTRLVHIETPDNPTDGISDIAAIAKIAHENGAVLSVDNTFASPLNQHPLDFGADFVVESLTKYINGHGDAQGGAIISTTWRRWTGFAMKPRSMSALSSVPSMPGRSSAVPSPSLCGWNASMRRRKKSQNGWNSAKTSRSFPIPACPATLATNWPKSR